MTEPPIRRQLHRQNPFEPDPEAIKNEASTGPRTATFAGLKAFEGDSGKQFTADPRQRMPRLRASITASLRRAAPSLR